MNWLLHKVVHHGGDGRVQHEGDEEEEGEESVDGDRAQEQRGVVLDVLQPRALLLVQLNLRHAVGFQTLFRLWWLDQTRHVSNA